MPTVTTACAVAFLLAAGLCAQQLGDRRPLAPGNTVELPMPTRTGEICHVLVTPSAHARLVVELCDENGWVLQRSKPTRVEHEFSWFAAAGAQYRLRIRNADDVPTAIDVRANK
ncbi:MAG: hypothetical protein U1E73_06255 [Planctomycetota bacterium]